MREKLSQKVAKKRKKLPKGIIGVTVKDGKEYYTYEKFRYMPEWAEYNINIKDDKRRLAMAELIMFYGCCDVDEDGLNLYRVQEEDMKYFNEVIRPELDRQHKRLREGKEI